MASFLSLIWKLTKIALILFVLLLITGLLFPVNRCRTPSKRTWAKNDVVQIVNAIKNFNVEYGYYPQVTEDGSCESAAANAKLFRILSGTDMKGNPKAIRFMEIPKAKKSRGLFHSGIDPQTGAWNDPWGHFYRVRITDYSALSPKSPYIDEKTPTFSDCLAWSLGKDGIQGEKNDSDDVTSWR